MGPVSDQRQDYNTVCRPVSTPRLWSWD